MKRTTSVAISSFDLYFSLLYLDAFWYTISCPVPDAVCLHNEVIVLCE